MQKIKYYLLCALSFLVIGLLSGAYILYRIQERRREDAGRDDFDIEQAVARSCELDGQIQFWRDKLEQYRSAAKRGRGDNPKSSKGS